MPGHYPYARWRAGYDDNSWMPLELVATVLPDHYLALTKPSEFAGLCSDSGDRGFLVFVNPVGFLQVFPGEQAKRELAVANPEAFARLVPGGVAAA